MKKKMIPHKSYLIHFELETTGDEFFRKNRTLKEIKQMIVDELSITHLWNVDPRKIKVRKL